MKVEMIPPIKPVRGGEVKVGNVYTNPHGRSFYKIVVGIVNNVERRRPWNNIVMLHVNVSGDIIGSSNQPMAYVKDHQDLIGTIEKMPTMKVEWLKGKGRP